MQKTTVLETLYLVMEIKMNLEQYNDFQKTFMYFRTMDITVMFTST